MQADTMAAVIELLVEQVETLRFRVKIRDEDIEKLKEENRLLREERGRMEEEQQEYMRLLTPVTEVNQDDAV